MSRLDHPALTKVHAVYQDESKLYIVVDTIRGSSLYEKIFKAGQMSESDSALIVQRLLSLTRYLHANGIAHRNLRPEMIFFETDGSLYDMKILDMITLGEVSKVSGKATMILDQESDMLETLLNGCHCYTRSPELVTIGE